MIEDAGVPSRRIDEMELSDIDCSAEEERVNGLLNEKEKIKELEKRLSSELNLRIGQMGYKYGNDEDEDDNPPEEEESKAYKKKQNKKKSSSKANHGSDGKLKQTRLIFTPKESSSIVGNKRF